MSTPQVTNVIRSRLQVQSSLNQPSKAVLSHTAQDHGVKPSPDDSDYTHTLPLTSPLYNEVISPFCDHLISRGYIPRWVTPNQLTACGLVCTLTALLCSHLKLYAWVAPLWATYALLDNLDGKQARATQKSSKAGDFLDHGVDSMVSATTTCVGVMMLIPDGATNCLNTWLALSGQIAFYVGTWAHFVVGETLLGGQVVGCTRLVTVDELHLLAVPGVALLRTLTPGLIDYPLFSCRWIHSWIVSALSRQSGTGTDITVGMVSILVMMVLSIEISVRVVLHLYRPSVLSILGPVLIYVAVSGTLLPPIMIMIPSFSLMAFMLLALRLKKPGSSVTNIWHATFLYTVVAVICKLCSLESKALSMLPPAIAVLLSCLAVALLCCYTYELSPTTTTYCELTSKRASGTAESAGDIRCTVPDIKSSKENR